MKFGAYLEARLQPQWRQYYINYKQLKSMIKALAAVESSAVDVPEGKGGERVTSLSMMPYSATSVTAKFQGKDITETDFFQALEEEMKKVDDFIHSKMVDLRAKVEHIAGKVAEIEDIQASLSKTDRDVLVSQTKNLGEEFLVLEKFVNLNYLGFHKILKKHDKQLPIPCQRFYMTRLHNQKWIKHDYSKLFVVLSEIHAKLRGDISAKKQEDTGQKFVRTTTKYWVPTQNISRVKHLILQHLPVFQHQIETLSGDSQLTNSVYLDNAQLELYHGRLDKLPSAIAVRFRWYQTEKPDIVFVERKTHFDSWTGDESVKERFTLKENQVLPFLRGEYTVEQKMQEMKASGKSEKDMANVKKLFSEIASQIDSKQLRPTMRTQYMRVAYQIPFDARVRISLDTNLCMIAENPQDGPDCLTTNRWYRDPDIPLPPTEFTLFPHAILEIKLSLREDEQVPNWVVELTDENPASGVPLATRVHKFSKFIHGCATLLSKSVQAVPYWVDDESIRASMLRSLPKEKRRSRTTGKNAESKNGELKNANAGVRGIKFSQEREPLLAFGERERFSLLKQQYGSFAEGEYANPKDDKDLRLKIRDMKDVDRSRYYSTAADGSAHFSNENSSEYFQRPKGFLSTFQEYLFGKRDAGDDFTEENKKVFKVRKTPMRIEPKVFFANERTYLSWLHMSITLGSIAAILLSFSSKQIMQPTALSGDDMYIDHQANGRAMKALKNMRIVGLTLLPVSILFVFYALGIFYWRGKNIRNRVDGDFFHDPIGPLMLGSMLLIALISIFALFIISEKIPSL